MQTALTGATLRILVNGTLSATLPVTSGVRQGDPLSPLLFNLALEPLLLALERAAIKAQAHADDTALALASPSEALRALSIITHYEDASGMLLNRGKSVALAAPSSPTARASGFRPCPGDRYLGVHLALDGRLSVLPGTWEKMIARLGMFATLPISLWGKMTLLHSYLRPKVLYQLVVVEETTQALEGWAQAERRLLNSGGTLSTNSRRIIAEERSHPLTWARLPPLQWDLDRRRLGLIPMLREMYPGTAASTPLATELTVPGQLQHCALRPFHSSVQRRMGLLGIRTQARVQRGSIRYLNTGRHILATGDKPQILEALSTAAMSRPLQVSGRQAQWADTFNTDWPALWATTNRTLRKLRSPVASFIWRLLNRSLPWASHRQGHH